MRFVAEVQGREYEIEADLSESVEVLRNQLFSLVDVPLESFDLVLEDYGVLTDETDLSRIQVKSNRLMLRKAINQLPGDWTESCSRIFIDRPLLQPAYKLGDKHVCSGCAQLCRAGVATEVDVHKEAFTCECDDECLFVSRKNEWYPRAIQLQVQRKYESDTRRVWDTFFGDGINRFSLEMRRHSKVVGLYEDPALQQAALALIPKVALETRMRTEESTSAFKGRDAYVEQLLEWFKHDFFTWAKEPPCTHCHGPTKAAGHTQPTPEELQYFAGNVELYRCPQGHITRFPRYNHPGKLLQTRTGRCGEWAICFGLILRANGYDARLIVDYTDHVWNEIWSEEQHRWLHCDSCEAKLDAPLLYEQGWGKKLTYVFADSKDGLRDVVRRYTQNFADVRTRRNSVPEPWIPVFIADTNKRIRGMRTDQELQRLRDREAQEDIELGVTKAVKAAEAVPRESGDLAWRQARGEMGPQVGEPKKVEAPKIEPEVEEKKNAEEVKSAKKEEEAKEKESVEEVKPAPAPTPIVEVSPPQVPQPKKAEPIDAKAALKRSLEAAFKQLTVGCGRSTCANEYCRSSGKCGELTPNEAATKAMQLLRDGKFRQCESS